MFSPLLLLELLLVFPSVDFGYDVFQLPLGLALGEVVHVVVLGRHSHQPLRLNVCVCPVGSSVVVLRVNLLCIA